jgi:small GTP-binding protein
MMHPSVCVLTARGMAAIASVALAGEGAQAILETIFRTGQPEARSGSAGMGDPVADAAYGVPHRVASAPRFCLGAVYHGCIVDGDRVIDEVVVGCEQDDWFVIHCHGNPLLVEQIVKLCQRCGAALVGIEPFMAQRHQAHSVTAIEAEAKLALQTCATITGAKIIAAQLTDGLLPAAQGWLEGLDERPLPQLWAECHQVLRKTSRARFLLNRCRIVLVGPPNSGKSTLLNRLAGKDEVIVSDTAGTTRDWVKITCRIGPLLADIYDTAGLDAELMQQDVDITAQKLALDLVRSADMNIFVYDVTHEAQAQSLIFLLGGFKGVIVANKCDLLTGRQRDGIYSKYVRLSAATGDGLEALTDRLLAALKVADFNPRTPICFTDRQLHILRQLLHTKEKPEAKTHLQSLIFGEKSV